MAAALQSKFEDSRVQGWEGQKITAVRLTMRDSICLCCFCNMNKQEQ